ncbi:MAG: hypothetical protein GY867_11695 [bacterium]|nr:hypothetical protein [bacterium]
MPQDKKSIVVFATYASSLEELQHAFYLAESIREFGGAMSESPIRIYVPHDVEPQLAEIQKRFAALDASVRTSHMPAEAAWFYYAGKVYAAGQAEGEAESEDAALVWMDEDTILLREPEAFRLQPGVSLAYRPVMHNRSGTLWGEEPNPFWKRIYEVLEIPESSLFPMTTPADSQKVNAYFNAGLLVVRPEKSILRNWGRDFGKLYRDSTIVSMCREKVDNRIFIHQTALVGAVLNELARDELVELPAEYSYPLFFEQMFGADRPFGSIEGIVTVRYDVYFRDPDPDWNSKLSGPSQQIDWLSARLGRR